MSMRTRSRPLPRVPGIMVTCRGRGICYASGYRSSVDAVYHITISNRIIPFVSLEKLLRHDVIMS